MKRAFTLLEVMIAFLILTLAGTVVGFQMYGAVSLYRFDQEVSELYQDLKEAQIIAITQGIDISLSFNQNKGVWSYVLSSEEPRVLISKKPHLLKQVTHLQVDKKTYGPHSKVQPASLTFYASGIVDPHPSLVFMRKKRRRQRGGSLLD